MEYILIQDDDCHWYVIPANKEKEFCKWAVSDESTRRDMPDYAKQVGGSPSLVKFKEYTIN